MKTSKQTNVPATSLVLIVWNQPTLLARGTAPGINVCVTRRPSILGRFWNSFIVSRSCGDLSIKEGDCNEFNNSK